MKQSDFIAAIASACPSLANPQDQLDIPVEDLGVDSLDLEILRTTLEKALGMAINEQLWQTAPTFRSLMDAI